MRCRLVFRCHLPSSVIHWPIAMAAKLSTKKVTRSQGNCNACQGWILLPVPHQGHFVFSAGSRQGWFSLWIEWLFHATPALRNRHWFCHREWLVWWNNTCSHSMTQHEQQEWVTRQTSRVHASSCSHQIKGSQCDCIPWLFTACLMQRSQPSAWHLPRGHVAILKAEHWSSQHAWVCGIDGKHSGMTVIFEISIGNPSLTRLCLQDAMALFVLVHKSLILFVVAWKQFVEEKVDVPLLRRGWVLGKFCGKVQFASKYLVWTHFLPVRVVRRN